MSARAAVPATASPAQVSDWAKRLAQLAFELEQQAWNGDRDGAARLETCVALAEAFVALDRVAVRRCVPAVIVRDADGEGSFREALERLAAWPAGSPS